MSWYKEIAEHLESYQKMLNDKMKSSQGFIGLLQQIFKLEESYSKSLENIGLQISKLINEQDGTTELYTILRSYLLIKSEQTKCFAMQLNNTLISEQQQFLIKQDNLQKEILQFNLANKKEYQQNLQTLNQFTSEFRNAIEEEKQHQLNRLQKKKLSIAVSELSFQNFLTIYNQFIDACCKDVINYQLKLSNLEQERKNLLQDSHMKFIIFEISVIRNLQYDLTGISQKLEQHQPNNGVMEQQLQKNISIDKIDFDVLKRDIYQQLHFKPESQLLNKVKKPIFDQIKSKDSENFEYISEESQSYQKIFHNVLLNNSITDEVIKKLSELLEVALPYSYTYCLEQVLSKVSSEKYQKNVSNYQVSHEVYLSVQKLLITLLDHCNKYQDYATVILEACQFAKKIVKRVYLPTENKEIKLSVFEGLMNHQVIQSSQIWIDQAMNLKKQPTQKICMFKENYVKTSQIMYTHDEYLNALQQIGCQKQIIENIRILFNTNNQNGQN
ncbi:unnamed protein product (macronuclear) [Paramecium tetraurelia]|uniref:FCH domain-containing protein n=1 Tax=Paramecium tetraurelia TaxID=5888 RepID=A0BNG6_PARTE|nr:uncharacterized protein GSPATT00030721001 [Paramecium tetraurelia]CAK60083.1 unnamed protein product [Paramecium tetraurelia]|eukprot:XP_001427481.1 hypothetical protein (macronuclear) [Paramecium tetraurelia strain d4-2]